MKIFIYINLLLFFVVNVSFAEIKKFNSQLTEINKIINEDLKDNYSFSGLSKFYNKINVYIFDEKKLKKITDDDFHEIDFNENIILVGRHKILIISNLKS